MINSLSISGRQVPQLLPQPSRACSPANSLTPCRVMASTMRCSETRRQEQTSRLSPARGLAQGLAQGPRLERRAEQTGQQVDLDVRAPPPPARCPRCDPCQGHGQPPPFMGSLSQCPSAPSRCHRLSVLSDQEASRVQLPSGRGRLAHQSTGSRHSPRPHQSPCQRVSCALACTRPCLNIGWPERGSTTGR